MSSLWIRGRWRRKRERDSNFQRLFQFSFPFNAISFMIPANTWLPIWKLPFGAFPLLAWLPIKGQPELQRTPAENPETAQDLPQPLPTGTMKVSAAALAVLLATAAFCTPSSASPCKSRSWPPQLPESDPRNSPDLALFTAIAFLLSEPYELNSYVLLFPDVQLSLIDP